MAEMTIKEHLEAVDRYLLLIGQAADARALEVQEYEATGSAPHRIYFDAFASDERREKILSCWIILGDEGAILTIDGPETITLPLVSNAQRDSLLDVVEQVARQPQRDGYSSAYLHIGTAMVFGTVVGS
jgi:hypothetical protein